MERAATETANLPRMTAEQSAKANALIRELCANFDDGYCLLLDDGYDPCPCPQLISNSLVCRYFRTAVLPSDRELYGEIVGQLPRWRCCICGKSITRTSNAVKYCKVCAVRQRRKKDTERKREKRLLVRKTAL